MRTLRLIGSVIMVIMMSLNFIACSDDDEEDNRPLAEKIIGHWVLTYEEGFIKDSEYPEDDEAWSHAPKDECEYFGNFTFREDGTYSEYDLDGDGTNDVYLYLSTDKGNSSCVDQFEIGGELSLDHETSGNLIIHQSIKRVWNEDKDYLYPIPTKDRVLTNGALTQNPGWNDGLIF